LILIDTAGRSPKNTMHLGELREFLPSDSDLETHLVLSATTRYQDLLQTVAEFEKVVQVDRLLFTKLDETSVYGAILNLVQRTQKPLSYVTVGQNVPDDIEIADPAKLARAILGGNEP
jgi:flagellar biosynthesis protein FlhF